MTDITPDLLLKAYAHGVFPMAKARDDNEVFWVQPKLRGVIPLNTFHISKSLQKRLRRGLYTVTVDRSFPQVIAACAKAVAGREDTWINNKIAKIFSDLFSSGLVHSIETWQDDELVGGLYGLAMGGAFFGESMFTVANDASKVALCHLVGILKRGNYALLDTQFLTDHLKQFGAIEISQKEYLTQLSTALAQQGEFGAPLDQGELEIVLSSQPKTQTS
jgi:leucyl/phenylalanyl-tRNA--protein transferase